MPAYRVRYRYNKPSVAHPNGIAVGVKTIKAEDEDDARFKLSGQMNVKGLIITSVEEVL